MKKIFISVILLFLTWNEIYAKDCDSELDSHLLKLNENSNANAEFVFGGYFDNENGTYEDYYKPMINLAYEYNFSADTLLYYNGAFKYRVSKDEPEGEAVAVETESNHGKGMGTGAFKFGFRHFYLQHKDESSQIKLGFLTTTLNEMLLVDERGLGADYKLTTGIVKTHVFATQIVSQFAREDAGCVSKTTFKNREIAPKTETFSDAFGGINFELDFEKHVAESDNPDDEFLEVKKEDAGKKPFKMDFTYYVESYDYLKDYKHFAALHQAYMLFGLSYAVEGAFQFYNEDVAFGGILKVSKTFFNDTVGAIKLFSGYTGWDEIKGDSPFMPLDSNIFLSDRQQYLTYDNNVVFYGINYRPVQRVIFEIAAYHNSGNTHSMELDINLTVYYTESAKAKIGYNLIEKPDITGDYYNQFYGEIRQIF